MKYLKLFELFESDSKYSDPTRSIDISQDRFLSLYEKDYTLHDKNQEIPLYRGNKFKGEFLFIDPSQSYRKSIERENIHLTLMSELESWKDFPKYNKSVIGSIDPDTAIGYSLDGICYEIIPQDNALIGVCPSSDIWTSFGGFGIMGRIRQTYNFLRYIGSNQDNWEVIKKDILDIPKSEDYIRKYKITQFHLNFLDCYKQWLDNGQKFWKNNKDEFNSLELSGMTYEEAVEVYNNIDPNLLIKFIEWLFDPELLGFKYIRYDENYLTNMRNMLNESSDSDLQIWVGDPCLLRLASYYDG